MKRVLAVLAVPILIVAAIATPHAARADGAYTGAVVVNDRSGLTSVTLPSVTDNDPGVVTGRGNDTQVRVTTGPWTFTFDGGGSPLHVGLYSNVDSTIGSAYNPGLQLYPPEGCFSSLGSFRVLELPAFAPDGTLTTFAADLEMQCYGVIGGTPPPGWLRASLRINASTPPALLVVPAALSLGDVTVGDSAKATVTLHGLGRGSISVPSLALSGPDAAMFSLESDTCSGTVLPGRGSCTVDVRFSPTATTAKSAVLTVNADAPQWSQAIPLTGRGLSPVLKIPSAIVLNGDAGNWVAGGQIAAYDPATPFWHGSDAGTVGFSSSDGTISFGAPDGGTLDVGHHDIPSGGPNGASYSIGVSFQGHGCSYSAGWIDVVEAPVFDTDGALLSFAGDFQANCDGSTTSVRGTVRWHTTAPAWDLCSAAGSVAPSGAPLVNSSGVGLLVTAAYPACVDQVALSNDGATWAARAYAPSVSWSLTDPAYGGTAADGAKPVYAKWHDVFGTWSSPQSTTFVLDTTPPAGTIAINDWATTTTSPDVTLTVPATDAGSGVAAVGLSNDGSTWTTRAYDVTQPWTLLPGSGTRTVWARWKDAAGNWSAPVSGSITLDTIGPVGSASINGGTAWTRTADVTVATPATDDAAVVAQVALSNDGVTWTVRPYAPAQSWTLAPANGTRTVWVKWEDGAGVWSGAVTATIGLDTLAPTVSVPSWRLAPPVAALSRGRAPVVVSWAGADATSAISRYQLLQSTDGGAWATVSTALGAPALTRNLVPNHTYRFAVRAVDNAGNTGAWSYGPSFRLTAVQQWSSLVGYGGTWGTSTSSIWWGGSAQSSSRYGSTASLTFTGRSIAWIGLRAPNRGRAQVYVNGVLVATVDLGASSTQAQRVVWSATWSSSATRTVKIRVLATSGRPRVDVDGFVVGR